MRDFRPTRDIRRFARRRIKNPARRRLIPATLTHLPESVRFCLPDFLMIGAQKAGTTTLYTRLCSHPQVLPALWKEVHFYDRAFSRGLRWYSTHFPRESRRSSLEARCGRKVLTGEATTSYLFDPYVPARVASTLPDTRAIILVRDPVERAIPAYWHNVRMGRETAPLNDALRSDLRRAQDGYWADRAPGFWADRNPASHYAYVARGAYASQVARWIEALGRERILVLESESLRDGHSGTAEVLAFLGLAPNPAIEGSPDRNIRRPGYEAPIDSALDVEMRAFFAPDRRELEAMIERELPWL